MNYFNQDRRCYQVRDYVRYLNNLVAETRHKEKLSIDDKVARVLLFNLEHYSRYNQEKGYAFTLYTLDHFAEIVPDENDMFRRGKIILNIPTKIKKNLIREYKEYVKTVEAIISATPEELEKMAEEGKVTIGGVRKSEYGEDVVVGGGEDDEEEYEEDEEDEDDDEAGKE